MASDARDARDASDDGGRSLDVAVRVARSTGFALDVAFEAPPGITVLFGPSGSGKSTTLGAVAGLVRPTAGHVRLGGDVFFDAATKTFRAVHERKIAYVFQSLALFPHMTAEANVVYGMDPSLPSAARRARACELLARLKVGHLERRRPRTFSGGEAQRVALARAFAMSPRVVLMDEPFSAMDQKLRAELALDVREFVLEARVPMLFVTHHPNEARLLGDRILMFEEGRITQRGDVSTLLGRRTPEDL